MLRYQRAGRACAAVTSILVMMVAAWGADLATPPVADAAVCGPGQLIDSTVPLSDFFVTDGKAYFPSTSDLTVIGLQTVAHTTVSAPNLGLLAAVDEAGHRFFMVSAGDPVSGSGHVSLFDTSSDTVAATSAQIPTSGANRWAQGIQGPGSYDPQRDALYFVYRTRFGTSPGTVDWQLARYDVAGGSFNLLRAYNPAFNPPSIAVDPASGRVYVIEQGSSNTRFLRARDPLTGVQFGSDVNLSLGVTGFTAIRILSIDSGVATLLVNIQGQGEGLARVDLASGVIAPPGATWSGALAGYTASLNRGFIGSFGGTQVREIQLSTGVLTSTVGVPDRPGSVPPWFARVAWVDATSRLLATVPENDQQSAALVSFPDPAACVFETTAPTVSHLAPPAGSTLLTGTTVSLDLSCGDSSDLVYCGAFVTWPVGGEYVRDGEPLPTAAAGVYRIRDIIAVDVYGNRGERLHDLDPSFDVTYEVVDGASTDTTAPTITLTTPPEGAQYSLGQAVNSAYSCQDEAGGSGLASCVGTAPSGSAIDTASAGSKSFVVNAADNAGHAATVSRSYDVLAGSAAGTYTGGETITTDPGGVGATPAVPLQTSLALPGSFGATTVSIGTQPTTVGLGGFAFFGFEVVVDAGGTVAPAATPFVATFRVDKTLLDGPPVVSPTDVQIFRDGVQVMGCTDATAAVPDPCIASKSIGPGGDGVYVVRTTHFSRFSFARYAWSLSGFFQPVDNLPVVNSATGGRAIPVKFTLGGNRGLDVFAAGYPTSQAYNCETNQPLDAIEETVPDIGPTLTYDAATGRYSYVWKTTKSWTGCRELKLRFRDGSELKAHFQFK